MTLPLDPNTTRKDYPLYSGLLSYFPNALAYVSYVSKKANDQHNPGEPLHWAREKSTDHLDCLGRHFLRAGEIDDDGLRESGKMAWRSLANLQIELEAALKEENSVRVTKGVARYKGPETIYDWSNADEGLMWAATDSDGESFFYEVKPYLSDNDHWVPPGGEGRIRKATILSGNDDVFVHTSLEARPQRSAV